MDVTDTIPHDGARTGRIATTRRVLTPEGREALEEARVASDMARDAREQAAVCAERRRRAVLAANLGGASYRTIAGALGTSVGNVQQLIIAARRDLTAVTTGGDDL